MSNAQAAPALDSSEQATNIKNIQGNDMKPKAKRADGQMSGLAGEFFVAAELLKRGLQTSITFGNAKAVDLHAHNETTGASFNVQVKTLRARNFFLISPQKVQAAHIYVFVLLNKPGEAVRYYIVRGAELMASPNRFSKGFEHPTLPGIHPKTFEELGYEDAWQVFGGGNTADDA